MPLSWPQHPIWQRLAALPVQGTRWILPQVCHGCHQPLTPGFASPLQRFLCEACTHDLPWVSGHTDNLTWVQENAWVPSPVLPGLDRLEVALAYTEPVEHWLPAYKYTGRHQLGPLLGAMLAHAFGPTRFAQGLPCDLLVPVPLHPKRLWWRGFNQALHLVHGWKRALASLPHNRQWVAQMPAVDARPLQRIRATPPQARLGAEARRQNVEGAFLGQYPQLIEGRRVWLVDDVITTGATLTTCAHLLRQMGATEVGALVLARA